MPKENNSHKPYFFLTSSSVFRLWEQYISNNKNLPYTFDFSEENTIYW